MAFATICLTAIAMTPAIAQKADPYSSALGSNGPQSYAPQSRQEAAAPSASARRNVIQSLHYDRSLETNRSFRQARMRKECGPISDPELRQSCLASFNKDEPYVLACLAGRALTVGPNS